MKGLAVNTERIVFSETKGDVFIYTIFELCFILNISFIIEGGNMFTTIPTKSRR